MAGREKNFFEKLGIGIGNFFKSIAEFFKKLSKVFSKAFSKPKSSASVNDTKSASGNSHLKKRRRKIRYDRILVLGAAVIVLIVLIVVLIKAIVASSNRDGDDKDKSNSGSDSTSVSDSMPDDLGTSTPEAVAYTEMSFAYDATKTGSLILVNNGYEYIFPETQSPSLISVMDSKNSSYTVSNANILLDQTTVKQLNSMMEAFSAETGLSNIEVKQGYRTREYQQELYDSGTSVSVPGFTEHHTGLCFNISIITGSDYKKYDYNDLPDEKYKWIYENCAQFGFVPRYTLEKETLTGCAAESDHFRYVGIPHAYYMTQNNLCLEEYLELLKNYTFDNPLTFTCDYDGKNYVIYYTAATVAVGVSDQTNVYIPTNAEYTISGDNMSGFIVTVIQ